MRQRETMTTKMRDRIFHFKVKDKTQQRARVLRREMTPMEKKLWYEILARKILGARFLRQKPIGIYIADFYCPRAKLIIEVDGDSHDATPAYDAKRTKFFNSLGIKVIRFDNGEVARGLAMVADDIENELRQRIKK